MIATNPAFNRNKRHSSIVMKAGKNRLGRVLNALPPDLTFGRGIPKYPWTAWLNGQARRLVVGKDFDCSVKTLERLYRERAKANGKRAHFIREYDPKGRVKSVIVQAV